MEKGMGAKRQDPARIRKRNAGFAAFFISGICAISCGVVVSLLQERLGFDYAMTGTLLSMMNIGNLAAGFAAAFLAGKIGMKKKRDAANHRICCRLSDHGLFRMDCSFDGGVFPGRNRKGIYHKYLYDPGRG